MVQRKRRKPDIEIPQLKSPQRKHRIRERGQRLSVKLAPPNGAQPPAASQDHPKETEDFGPLMKLLGTTDAHFAQGLFGQLFNASARENNRFDGDELFFSLAVIKSAKPNDEPGAMQLAQMALVHAAVVRLAGRLARAQTLQEQDSAIRGLNQLARTYMDQLAGLKRHRAGAEQKVMLQQNVSVNDGGQAIVGAVTPTTRGMAPEEIANAKPALTDARQPAMETIGASELVTISVRVRRET